MRSSPQSMLQLGLAAPRGRASAAERRTQLIPEDSAVIAQAQLRAVVPSWGVVEGCLVRPPVVGLATPRGHHPRHGRGAYEP